MCDVFRQNPVQTPFALCQGRGVTPALKKVSAPEINFPAPAQPQTEVTGLLLNRALRISLIG